MSDDAALYAIETARKLTRHARQPLFRDMPQATAPYYKFLYFLMRVWQTRVAVELGVYRGYSLAHLGRGNPAASIVGVDRTLEHVNRQVVPANAKLLEMDSVEFLQHWSGINPEKIGLLHLDTEHSVHQVERELEAALPLMAKPGVICIDDVFINPEMQQWWYRLPHLTVLCMELHATGYGVIIV